MEKNESILKVPDFKETPIEFKGIKFDVRVTEEHGFRRDVVVHPGAVTILPILDEDRIIMIRNERVAVGRVLWELPAGTLEKNELPLNTAKRELIEETGYEAKEISFLNVFFTTPGICNEVMYTYVAKDLVHVGQSLDEGEKIEIEIVTWDQVMTLLNDGTILDGKTIAVLLTYLFKIRNQGQGRF